MRVFVYWNLHRKCWSVRALQGSARGRVIAHRNAVTLTDAIGKVSAAGNARVRREGKKNVHAGIVGHWEPGSEWSVAPCDPGTECVTYNPYKDTSFVVLNAWARPTWPGSKCVSMRRIGVKPVVVASLA